MNTNTCTNSYKRYTEWEKKQDVIRTYLVGRSIYYVVENERSYIIQYWPDKNSKIETVSILESYQSKEKAMEYLETKVKQ